LGRGAISGTARVTQTRYATLKRRESGRQEFGVTDGRERALAASDMQFGQLLRSGRSRERVKHRPETPRNAGVQSAGATSVRRAPA